jgi:hypothetical protein
MARIWEVHDYVWRKYSEDFPSLVSVAVSKGLTYEGFSNAQQDSLLELLYMLFEYDKGAFSEDLEAIHAFARGSESLSGKSLVLKVTTSGKNGLMMHPLRLQAEGWIDNDVWLEFLSALVWLDNYEAINLRDLSLKARIEVLHSTYSYPASSRVVKKAIGLAPAAKSRRLNLAADQIADQLRHLQVGPTSFENFLSRRMVPLADLLRKRALGDLRESETEINELVAAMRAEYAAHFNPEKLLIALALWGDKSFNFKVRPLSLSLTRLEALAEVDSQVFASLVDELAALQPAHDSGFETFLNRLESEYDVRIEQPRKQTKRNLEVLEYNRVEELKAFYANGGQSFIAGRNDLEDKNATQDV